MSIARSRSRITSGRRGRSRASRRKPAWLRKWAIKVTPVISSRQTCELIWDGAIGDVREVHAWTSATRWNKTLTGRPQDDPTPSGVNWDLWLGPREPRGYSAALNPVRWRDFWDFGTAPIGDFFCHNFDPAMWALNLREPLSIEASAVGPVDKYIAPPAGLYTYRFGPRGGKPAVKFTWYEGGLKPTRPDAMEDGDQF